jgi:glycosyltransferase involved in cell wall biosynthesis
MSSPLVSICIPAYKAERYLAETLESVRAQTFSDWEVIVTEDGSKDRTEEIVRHFAGSVKQTVVYDPQAVNQGLPATRNTGISKARGECIALLDSDDVWTPEHLQQLVQKYRETNADLVHAGSLLFDSDTGRELEVRAPSPADVTEFPISLYVGRYIIQPSSVMLTRELWKRVGGFNPKFRYVEDREMWLRCARAGGRFAYTGGITCRYRKHASALSKHAGPMAVAAAEVCEQHVDWERLPRSLRTTETAGAWTSAGRILMRENPRAAASHFRRALRYSRFAPRLWLYWGAATAMGLVKPQGTSS